MPGSSGTSAIGMGDNEDDRAMFQNLVASPAIDPPSKSAFPTAFHEAQPYAQPKASIQYNAAFSVAAHPAAGGLSYLNALNAGSFADSSSPESLDSDPHATYSTKSGGIGLFSAIANTGDVTGLLSTNANSSSSSPYPVQSEPSPAEAVFEFSAALDSESTGALDVCESALLKCSSTELQTAFSNTGLEPPSLRVHLLPTPLSPVPLSTAMMLGRGTPTPPKRSAKAMKTSLQQYEILRKAFPLQPQPQPPPPPPHQHLDHSSIQRLQASLQQQQHSQQHSQQQQQPETQWPCVSSGGPTTLRPSPSTIPFIMTHGDAVTPQPVNKFPGLIVPLPSLSMAPFVKFAESAVATMNEQAGAADGLPFLHNCAPQPPARARKPTQWQSNTSSSSSSPSSLSSRASEGGFSPTPPPPQHDTHRGDDKRCNARRKAKRETGVVKVGQSSLLPLRNEDGSWADWALLHGAKERNKLIKQGGLTPEEANDLKKQSRRMKQMLAQRKYTAAYRAGIVSQGSSE